MLFFFFVIANIHNFLVCSASVGPQLDSLMTMHSTRSENESRDHWNVTLRDVYRAAERLSHYALRTPLLTSTAIDSELSNGQTRFHFKAEHLQTSGSFKFRGALNAVAALIERGDHDSNIIAHSSGNHGLAVAAVARLLGRQATVVVPENSSAVKVAAAREHGAEIIYCGPSIAERIATANSLAARLNGVQINCFDNSDVVAGQGTIALELLNQIHDLQAIVVPVGSGSLIAGISIVVKTLRPEICIIGVQPTAASDAVQGHRIGYRVSVSVPPVTIADGLRTAVGDIGWYAVSTLVDHMLTVTEHEIEHAMVYIHRTLDITVEPSAAVGVAAARSHEFRQFGHKNVAIILTGGNV